MMVLWMQLHYLLIYGLCFLAAGQATSLTCSVKGDAYGDKHLGFNYEWLSAMIFCVCFFFFSFNVQPKMHDLYFKTVVL